MSERPVLEKTREQDTRPRLAKDDALELGDVIRAVWQAKWRIMLTTLVVMAGTAGISLAMPKVYRASAVLVPPEVDQAWPTIDGLKTRFGAAAVGGAIKPSTSATDVITGILKSRRVSLALIEKFNLRTVYQEERALIKLPPISLGEKGGGGPVLTDILKTVENRMEIRATKEGLLSISIEDQDPGRAAEMVQFCLDELGRVNMELQTTYNQYLARILDPPMTPDKKYKPRVMINTLVSGVAMGFLWMLFIVCRLSLASVAEPRRPVELGKPKQSSAPAPEAHGVRFGNGRGPASPWVDFEK